MDAANSTAKNASKNVAKTAKKPATKKATAQSSERKNASQRLDELLDFIADSDRFEVLSRTEASSLRIDWEILVSAIENATMDLSTPIYETHPKEILKFVIIGGAGVYGQNVDSATSEFVRECSFFAIAVATLSYESSRDISNAEDLREFINKLHVIKNQDSIISGLLDFDKRMAVIYVNDIGDTNDNQFVRIEYKKWLKKLDDFDFFTFLDLQKGHFYEYKT